MTHVPGQPSRPPEQGRSQALFPVLSSADASAIDPVCGMTVDPATARASTQYKGRPYYFCCPSCLQKFEADPERYLAKPAGTDHEHAAAPPAPPAPGTTVEYTCPMHPEVISDRPGSCPIC